MYVAGNAAVVLMRNFTVKTLQSTCSHFTPDLKVTLNLNPPSLFLIKDSSSNTHVKLTIVKLSLSSPFYKVPP